MGAEGWALEFKDAKLAPSQPVDNKLQDVLPKILIVVRDQVFEESRNCNAKFFMLVSVLLLLSANGNLRCSEQRHGSSPGLHRANLNNQRQPQSQTRKQYEPSQIV